MAPVIILISWSGTPGSVTLCSIGRNMSVVRMGLFFNHNRVSTKQFDLRSLDLRFFVLKRHYWLNSKHSVRSAKSDNRRGKLSMLSIENWELTGNSDWKRTVSCALGQNLPSREREVLLRSALRLLLLHCALPDYSPPLGRDSLVFFSDFLAGRASRFMW